MNNPQPAIDQITKILDEVAPNDPYTVDYILEQVHRNLLDIMISRGVEAAHAAHEGE